MPYRVKAQQREGWSGRWRSGRFFPASEWTLLADDELTPEMQEDPVLLIEILPPETAIVPESLTLARCEAFTSRGEQCKRDAVPGSRFCSLPAHQKTETT